MVQVRRPMDEEQLHGRGEAKGKAKAKGMGKQRPTPTVPTPPEHGPLKVGSEEWQRLFSRWAPGADAEFCDIKGHGKGKRKGSKAAKGSGKVDVDQALPVQGLPRPALVVCRAERERDSAEKKATSAAASSSASGRENDLPNDNHNSCLGMFMSLSEEQKHKLRRSLWSARNKAIALFKKYKYLNIRGEELEWPYANSPFQREQQLAMLRTATRKLFELDANDAAVCPYRRGAAMDYIIKEQAEHAAFGCIKCGAIKKPKKRSRREFDDGEQGEPVKGRICAACKKRERLLAKMEADRRVEATLTKTELLRQLEFHKAGRTAAERAVLEARSKRDEEGATYFKRADEIRASIAATEEAYNAGDPGDNHREMRLLAKMEADRRDLETLTAREELKSAHFESQIAALNEEFRSHSESIEMKKEGLWWIDEVLQEGNNPVCAMPSGDERKEGR